MKPVPDADTKPYWDGIAKGELRLQRCEACGAALFYPRAVCPHCFGGPLRWFTAAGTGRVYSFTVVHRAFGEFAGQVPFTVALVDLDDGVRMMTRIVGADHSRVQIGMRVNMTVEQIADASLPCFRLTQKPPEPQVTKKAKGSRGTQKTQGGQKPQKAQESQVTQEAQKEKAQITQEAEEVPGTQKSQEAKELQEAQEVQEPQDAQEVQEVQGTQEARE